MPKISSIASASWICCSQGEPTRLPTIWSQPEIAGRNHDCRSWRKMAPTTTPQTLPRPPSTIITRIITETGNMNMSGVAVCSLAI